MLKQNKNGYFDAVQNIGDTDYVENGKIHKNAPIKLVLVGSQSDLALLTDYEPGTIAYTAAFATMWQLGVDGTWAEFE